VRGQSGLADWYDYIRSQAATLGSFGKPAGEEGLAGAVLAAYGLKYRPAVDDRV